MKKKKSIAQAAAPSTKVITDIVYEIEVTEDEVLELPTAMLQELSEAKPITVVFTK